MNHDNLQGGLLIKEITNIAELEAGALVIRNSFQTVANEFGLTKNNSPTHPAFITVDRLQEAKDKGVVFFGFFDGNKQIGLVALEKSTEDVYFLERLSVLPNYRHHGYGKKLLDYGFNYVSAKGGKVIKIALINKHAVLKKWYLDYGFIETGTKQFPHLLFTVCFMEKGVNQEVETLYL